MEEYPEELRTPPLGLVALVGCNEQHIAVSKHIQAEQPPLNTLAVPDFTSLFKLLQASSSKKQHEEVGVIKRDWLLKHRTRVPSVIAAFFSSDQFSTDLTEVLSLIENLRHCTRSKSTKLVVAFVPSPSQSNGDPVLTDDQISSIRKVAEIDAKCVVVFNSHDPMLLKQSLIKLASLFSELSFAYYRDEGRRKKTRVEKKNFNFPELNVRYCFKVAVYAEIRRDWVEALRFYEDAYLTLREMVKTSSRLPAVQRLVQIKAVAEQLSFKISTLLFHGGKLNEAIAWFRQHIASYKKLVGVPQVAFLHGEWMSRQFLVFAELLETRLKHNPDSSVPPDRSFTEWEYQSSYYYHLAAIHLKGKQKSLKHSLSIAESFDQEDTTVESVVPSVFIGQYSRLLEAGDAANMLPLTDEEFISYSINEAKRFQDSFEIIALLKRSHEAFTKLKAKRMASLCAFETALEYLHIEDYDNARKLFDIVASVYREERWASLLWEVLGYLRECSKKGNLIRDFTEYSLQMAALPFHSVIAGESEASISVIKEKKESILKDVLSLVSDEGSVRDPIHIEIDQVSPLRLILLTSMTFHEQIVKPGAPTLVTLSLLSQLPSTIDLDQIEVQFNRSECNFSIVNAQKNPLAPSVDNQTRRIEHSSDLQLVSKKWLRLTYSLQPELSGKLECLYIVIKIGTRLIISCRVESPASLDDLPIWKDENSVESSPVKDLSLAISGQKVVQVEEPDPRVDVSLNSSGPALVGEHFSVPVIVSAKQHPVFSGELKINLVDVRGGGLFSPREADALSPDSLHVELLSVSADSFSSNSDDVKKIQQSFGLVTLPDLPLGESWSCNLKIKWYRPKPIMLFVSLGYFPNKEAAPQKVHVHKSLQIEGKSAVIITHNLMLPHRQDPLVLSNLPSSGSDPNRLPSLPVKIPTVLVIKAKNCSHLPLEMSPATVETVKEFLQSQNSDRSRLKPALVGPNEEFKTVYYITPLEDLKNVSLGSVEVSWRRDEVADGDWVTAKSSLPFVNVESPPLIVRVEIPPYGFLGDAFTLVVKIRNQTKVPEEVKFALGDAQSFVVSGSQSDSVYVLPTSESVVGFKVVPLAAGLQILPRILVTSVRHSASFRPSSSSSSIFVYPSESCVEKIASEGKDVNLHVVG